VTLLSICIVNWNTKDFLSECLSSIAKYPPTIPYEVIVVDNASSDGSTAMISSEFPSTIIIANTRNEGYAAGNNQALSQAGGDWLLLLNADVCALPGTFDNAIDTASKLPDFGALGIKQIGADGKVQQSVRSFPDPNGVLWELLGFSKAFHKSQFFGSYRMSWFDYNGTIEVDQPMATFLLTTRDVYQMVGGLDEQFPIFFNDVDLCYRIKQASKKVYYTDRAEIIHYGGGSTGRANKAAMALESKKSFLKFYEKYYKKTLPVFVYNAICLMVRASILLQKK
jgi:GT2 family glycosyltransferase